MVRKDRKIKYHMSFVYIACLINNVINKTDVKNIFKKINLYFNLTIFEVIFKSKYIS